MDIGNRSVIRKQNQQKIVEYIIEHNGASRAEIAKALSLSKPASSENISDLLERKILIESGVAETAVGKKGTLLQLNETAYHILIIDVTTAWIEHKIQVCVCDLSSYIIYETKISMQNTACLEDILNQISNWIEQGNIKETIKAIVVSVAGIMKEQREQHLYMEMLHEVSCKEAFEHHFGIDTYVYNDVNLMAIGEQHRTPNSSTSFAYLWLDVAVGGAVVLDGVLYEGIVGGAGEFGFLPVVRQEGKRNSIGLLHEYISLFEIEARVNQEYQQSEYLNKAKVGQGKIVFSDLVKGVSMNDDYCIKAAEEIAFYVAYACQASVAILDLEEIILGGHLTQLGDIIKIQAEKQLHSLGYNQTQVAFAQVENASFYGAGYLGAKHIIENLILE